MLTKDEFLARVEHLKTIDDGWYNGVGLAPNHDDLDWFVKTFLERCEGLPFPYLYPIPSGGFAVEWDIGICIGIFDRHTCTLIVPNGERIVDFSRECGNWTPRCTLNLMEEDSWVYLISALRGTT